MKREEILNKCKKILNKSVFVIEFILALLFWVQLLSLFTTSAYQRYVSLLSVIGFVMTGALLVGLIIYIWMQNKKVIENIFLAFAIPISIAFAIIMLPLNIPDEGAHIVKAYDISLGHLVSQIDEQGNTYCVIPKELENYENTRIKEYSDLIKKELTKTTDYKDVIEVPCAARRNSPILYIGSALAFAIGRLFGINIFLAIYLARLFNVIIFLAFGYFTIKKIPFGKVTMAVYLTIPMMLHQAASCSADSILNTTLVYYIIHLIYMVFKETPITKKDKIILYIFTALIATFKYIYILVAGILFIIVFSKKEEKKQNVKTILIMILIGSICSIGWFAYTSKFTTEPQVYVEYLENFKINPGGQIEYILERPLDFITVIFDEVITYVDTTIYDAIGARLAWLNITIPNGIITAFLIILIITAISEKNNYEFSPKSKIWVLTLVVAIEAILCATLYIIWTPVGDCRVGGLQGRYFTPIYFLPLLCLVKKNSNWDVKYLKEKMMIMSTILNLSILFQIMFTYIKK